MPGYSHAFISYQTQDKLVAARLKISLERVGIRAFLAHEDIEVSDVWRSRILQELRVADMFIAVLSQAYLESLWCVQESGVAAFRDDLLVVPLSLDGTIPQGFLSSFQSVRIDGADVDIAAIAPAFVKNDLSKGIDTLILVLKKSVNYRSAEAIFSLIMPHVRSIKNEQAAALISAAAETEEVSNAMKCVREYIPALLRAFPSVGDTQSRSFLVGECKRYGVTV